MIKGILVDSRKCIGCGACCEACKSEHHLSGEPNPADLGADTFTVVKKFEGVFVRKLCRHCVSPACASSCPVGALHKLPDGPVVYDPSKCIGCRYCFVACPYGVPRYQWNSTRPQVRKCDFCADRLSKGQPTACAEVCPRHATIFGYRGELLDEARKRINQNPDQYFPHIFGEQEAGGSSILMIASKDLMKLGLKIPAATRPMSSLTALSMESVPPVGLATGTILLGLWWTFKRRQEVAEAERNDKKDGHGK